MEHDQAPSTKPPSSDVSALTVVVLGMHRTGTSAVAGALRDAGLSAGPDDEMWPPLPDNPRFYGERPDVVGFDDRMLAALGWSWDSPAAAPDPSPPRRDDLVGEGRQLAKQLLAGGVELIKDPRISLLLPWWRRILLDRFVAIVTMRPPEEVAWSLSVRDGLPFEVGLALWLAYQRHLASGLDGLPVIIVDYDALTAEPRRVVGDILEGLERLGIAGGLDADRAAAAVVPELRRSTQPSREGDVLAAQARQAAASWLQGPVVVHERFSGSAMPPASWEISLLELQRRLRQEQTVRLGAEHSLRDVQQSLDDARMQASVAREARDETEERMALAVAAAQAARDRALGARDATIDRRVERLVQEGAPAPERAVASETAIRPVRRTDEPSPGSATVPRSLAVGSDAQTTELLRGLLERDQTRTMWRRRMRGALTGRWPVELRESPLFDARWYVQQYPDVAEAHARPWRHYLRHGWKEGRDPNTWFDVSWYLDQNPDVASSGAEPLGHYLERGWREGRDPGPRFSSWQYLRANPDVVVAGMNPLLHYLRHGLAEGREAYPIDQVAPGRPSLSPALPVASLRSPQRVSRRRRAAPPALPSEDEAIHEARERLPRGARVVLGADRTGSADAGVETLVPDPGRSEDGIAPGLGLVVALEDHRRRGVDHLLIPSSRTWWLEHWPELRRYLTHFRALDLPNGMMGWRLRSTVHSDAIDALIATATGLVTRPPAVLCWGASDGLEHALSRDAATFRADTALVELPYIDRSIDIVALGAGDDSRVAEAIRVASLAVIRDAGTGRRTPRVVWRGSMLARVTDLSVLVHGQAATGARNGAMTRIRDALPPISAGEVIITGEATADAGARAARTEAGIRTRSASAPQGVAASAGLAANDLVLYLDGSAWPVPGAIEALVSTLADDPSAVAAICSVWEAEAGDGPTTRLSAALVDRTRLGASDDVSVGDDAGPGYALPSTVVRRVPSALALAGHAHTHG